MRNPIFLPCQGGVAQRKAEGLPSPIRLQAIKKTTHSGWPFLLAIDIYFVSKRNSVVVVKGTPALTNSTGKLGQ